MYWIAIKTRFYWGGFVMLGVRWWLFDLFVRGYGLAELVARGLCKVHGRLVWVDEKAIMSVDS